MLTFTGRILFLFPGGFESPYQFLFVCPKYTVARNMYLPNNRTNYTTRDLLFGKESEPVSENERLFLQVQDFIIKSGSFMDSFS